MEGGANVIIEAVTSGVPVLASDISGNRGMLGEDYAGYFAPGDAAALARLIDRVAVDPAYRARLLRQCAARRRLFAPGRERAQLLDLVDNLLLRNP
jgi:glycosyltransferase involved in cell wall biosynthesis